MLEIPVFRRTASEGGQIITSPTKALQYATIASQNLRLGKSAGFRDSFRFYCLVEELPMLLTVSILSVFSVVPLTNHFCPPWR